MKLEEYKEWLKENGNYEEVMAYEIAKKLIWFHESEYYETVEDLFPRHILTKGNERIYFTSQTFKLAGLSTRRILLSS